jgi:phosphohistidine phosphatase
VQVILFRHGLAVERGDERFPRDADRPLTRKGEKRVRQAARGLVALGVAPDLVLHSPLVRAEQTAELISRELGLSRKQRSETRSLLPGRKLPALAEELSHLEAKSVLCVGHAPHLDRFLALVVGARTGAFELGKAGAACLKLGDLPTPVGELEWLLSPAALRRLGE